MAGVNASPLPHPTPCTPCILPCVGLLHVQLVSSLVHVSVTCVALCCVALWCSALRKMNEKRQLFNMYKTQKKKEEAEEEQERVRKNREDIFVFLEEHEMVHAETRFS